MEVKNVLIVEDENIVALDLSRTLTRLGYQVVGTAPSAHRALQLMADRKPDVILMDIHIKGNRDGIELADYINQYHQIPIIFLTAYSEDSTLARARVTRPYGYLLKPFSERELHVAIQVALERHQADRQLAKWEAHFKLALNAAQLGTWEMETASGPVMLGYSPSGELTRLKNWEQLAGAIIEPDRARVTRALDQLRRHADREISVEFCVHSDSLGQRWFTLHGKSFNGNTGHHRVVGVLQDVTDQHAAREQLRQAATAFRFSADGIVVLDQDRKVRSVNRAFSRITGQEQDQCYGQELSLLDADSLGDHTSQSLWRALQQNGSWQGEVSFPNTANTWIHALVNIAATPDPDSQQAQYVVVISDITAVREAQQKLSHIAYYDTLTGLPNRNLFMDRLDMCVAKAKREGTRFGLLFLDLDHFKRVNDTLGHQMGDNLLSAVAQRLKAQLRLSDTLCRIGGDEFIVIAESINSQQDLEQLAAKLTGLLDQPLPLGNVELVPSASIGICIYPDHTRDRDEMIKMADTAMYAAKNNTQTSYMVYQADMYEHVAQYFRRDQDLRQGLKNREFLLYYQPQYDSRCGHLVGLEALIRWQHPKLGLLGPSDIVPIAETSALIISIGRWVIEEVCRQLRAWLDAGFNPGRVAINVSARQLESRHFANQLVQTAQRHQVPLSALEIEVTESCLQNSEIGLHNLRLLKKMGLNISIDDFGTGFSCLSSLKTLPINTLKIDRSFVADIHTDTGSRAIANAIIALAQQMSLRTVAEGIEAALQADLLRQAGCDEFQGYLYSEPVPALEIDQHLTAPQTPARLTHTHP